MNVTFCFVFVFEEYFFIDHQDWGESEEDEERIAYEELKEREGYKLLLKYLGGTAKNSDVS